MFLIRQGKQSDLEILLKLAKMVHFINLPADQDVIADKLRLSAASFRSVRHGEASLSAGAMPAVQSLGGAGGSAPLFMFIAEDLSTTNIVGTSTLVSRMGGPGEPNVAMKLRKREFFSSDLQSGTSHITAQLVLDESGPTEIGGLIVGPSFRRHPLKVGRQLSLVRFHYLGLHRERFQDRVLAEMMAPLTPDARNTFWEYFGRRFINLTYDEADRFCQKSREFMTSLLPREEIYLTLLPPAARALVGEVGKDTIPARRMLENLGFAYHNMIDPFDAGPHLEAQTDDISLVKETRLVALGEAVKDGAGEGMGFVSADEPSVGSEQFRCVWTEYALKDTALSISDEAMSALGVSVGAKVGFTPTPKSKREDTSKQAEHESAST
jgi:arginine N-succinyltransferase